MSVRRQATDGSTLDSFLKSGSECTVNAVFSIDRILSFYEKKIPKLNTFLLSKMDELVTILFNYRNKNYYKVLSLFKCTRNPLLLNKLIDGIKYLDKIGAVLLKKPNIVVIEGIVSILEKEILDNSTKNKHIEVILSSKYLISGLVMNIWSASVFNFLKNISKRFTVNYLSFIPQLVMTFSRYDEEILKTDELKKDFDFSFQGLDVLKVVGIDISNNLGNFWELCYIFLKTHVKCKSFRDLLSIYFQGRYQDFCMNSPDEEPLDSDNNVNVFNQMMTFQLKCGTLLSKKDEFLGSNAAYFLRINNIGFSINEASLEYLINYPEYICNVQGGSEDYDEEEDEEKDDEDDDGEEEDDDYGESLHLLKKVIRSCILVPYKQKYIKNEYRSGVPTTTIIQNLLKLIEKIASSENDLKYSIRSTLLYWDKLHLKGFNTRAVALKIAKAVELGADEDDPEFRNFEKKYAKKPYKKDKLTVNEERLINDDKFYNSTSFRKKFGL